MTWEGGLGGGESPGHLCSDGAAAGEGTPALGREGWEELCLLRAGEADSREAMGLARFSGPGQERAALFTLTPLFPLPSKWEPGQVQSPLRM